MCNVWIEEIHNYTGETFTLNTNDGTWWPVINGHKYRGGKYQDPVVVGPGSSMSCKYFLVPFIEFGRLRVIGPEGAGLNFAVGPEMADGNDYLRGLDDVQEEVLKAPMGPQGMDFWAASVSLHLLFGPKPEVRFLVWSANKVGPDIIAAAGQVFLQVASGLWQALIPAKGGGR